MYKNKLPTFIIIIVEKNNILNFILMKSNNKLQYILILTKYYYLRKTISGKIIFSSLLPTQTFIPVLYSYLVFM